MNTGTCARCKKVFWEDEMASNGKRKPVYCRPCVAEIMRDWRNNNRKRNLENERAWRRNHPNKCNERNREWKLLEPEKVKAINDLNNAVVAGRITRLPCEMCGAFPTDAHHDDYSKPLEVRWLCHSCHQRLHQERREQSASPIC